MLPVQCLRLTITPRSLLCQLILHVSMRHNSWATNTEMALTVYEKVKEYTVFEV
uniref:Uncharacterized protein n=1 Tax=Anguilla anguilla TaxID=7936 RepID=A0A0E9Q512_ANGAN